MEAKEKQRLLEALAKAGWRWRDGALYAPNETIWLDSREPWNGDLKSFRDRMSRKVKRLKKNLRGLSDEHAVTFERALVDVVGLVSVLEMLLT